MDLDVVQKVSGELGGAGCTRVAASLMICQMKRDQQVAGGFWNLNFDCGLLPRHAVWIQKK